MCIRDSTDTHHGIEARPLDEVLHVVGADEFVIQQGRDREDGDEQTEYAEGIFVHQCVWVND